MRWPLNRRSSLRSFDVIAPSTLHGTGFALRFPRIVRLRPDKSAADIDTLERVEEIYREMLEREDVPEGRAAREKRAGAQTH
jgi:hypothetical protein